MTRTKRKYLLIAVEIFHKLNEVQSLEHAAWIINAQNLLDALTKTSSGAMNIPLGTIQVPN